MTTTIHEAYNMVKVNVSGTYDASTTSIDLDTGEQAKCPTPPYWMIWWDATNYANPFDDPKWELVEVTAHNASDNITVVRGQQTTLGGLAASTKNTGGASYKMANIFTAYDLERLRVRAGFRVNLNASDQTGIVTSTETKIEFDTEDFDLTGEFDSVTNYRFTATRPLIMQVNLAATMVSMGDGDQVVAYIRKNGSVVAQGKSMSGLAGNVLAQVSDIVSLVNTDYLDFAVWHDYSGNRDLSGTVSNTFASAFELLPQ